MEMNNTSNCHLDKYKKYKKPYFEKRDLFIYFKKNFESFGIIENAIIITINIIIRELKGSSY